MGERKFVQMVLVTRPRYPQLSLKTIRNLLQRPWTLVCSIGDVGPSKCDPYMLTMTYFTENSNLFLNASKCGKSL